MSRTRRRPSGEEMKFRPLGTNPFSFTLFPPYHVRDCPYVLRFVR
jgi:hypothetical protein